MDVLSNIWKWLLDENNRGTVALLVAIIGMLGGAVWVVFAYRREHRHRPQDPDASNRNTHLDHAGAAQYVERMEGGSLTIDAGPNAEQIRTIIEPLLDANSDQAERIAQLSRQFGL